MDILTLLKLLIYVFCLVLPSSYVNSSSYAQFHNGSLANDTQSVANVGFLDAIAFRVEDGEHEVKENLVYIYNDETYAFRVFGLNFGSNHFSLTFTKRQANKGDSCDDMRSTEIYQSTEVKQTFVLFHVTLPKVEYPLYFCIREENQTAGAKSEFIHQGHDAWMILQTKQRDEKSYMLPLWLQILVVVILLVFSGLFSGLNLGLMSLDQTELNIMIASGTEKEKRYAKAIKPLRKRGNFLLCTILLGNVLVNNCLTILLDDLTGSGWYAIAGATFAIVVFGEILPQAICSRHGLAVGANTIWFTKTFMLLTFPLSFPISLILDKILGEEIGYVYNRDRLRELLKLTEKDIGLVRDEVNIITGALELSKKTVRDIMTKIDDIFMIEYNSVLDFETLTKIMDSGYTRIPVYEEDRSNVVALLNTKDLALVDPDNKSPLKDITAFYKRPLLFVFEDMRLDVILQDFKKGGSHMAMVQKVVNDGPGDPFYQVIGLVTLEDVIEEIIQAEINDEFDVITDNRNRQPRATRQKDYSVFNLPSHHNQPRLTPQLQLASFQFLSATLAPFRPPHMTERILHKLMGQNIVFECKVRPKEMDLYLYQHEKPADYFILIVQGRVLVQSGKERLTYEAGSFVYFGLQSLLTKNEPSPTIDHSGSKIAASMDNSLKESQIVSVSKNDINKTSTSENNLIPASGPFHPDYTVKALTDLQYIRINREQYYIAWKVSQLEQDLQKNMPINNGLPDDTFEKEWKKSNYYYDNYNDSVHADKSVKLSPTSQVQFYNSGNQGYTGGLLQNLRRTFGLSSTGPNDSVNLLNNSDFPPPAQMSPDKTKIAIKLAPKSSFSQMKEVMWYQKENPEFTIKRSSIAAIQSTKIEPLDKDKNLSPGRKVKPPKIIAPSKNGASSKDQDKIDDEEKGQYDKNTSCNIPDTTLSDKSCNEQATSVEGSKMETEALLQESLVEVKVIKP